jgi:hypothetical protein
VGAEQVHGNCCDCGRLVTAARAVQSQVRPDGLTRRRRPSPCCGARARVSRSWLWASPCAAPPAGTVLLPLRPWPRLRSFTMCSKAASAGASPCCPAPALGAVQWWCSRSAAGRPAAALGAGPLEPVAWRRLHHTSGASQRRSGAALPGGADRGPAAGR